MAKDKKSVIVYVDWIATFNKLEDDEAGRLIKHFFSYVNDLNPTSDRLTELLFEPIKQQLKRDLKAYEQTCERNSLNASLRWNKKNATACDRIRTDAKHADNDNDNDKEEEKEKEKDKEQNKEKEYLSFLQKDFIPIVEKWLLYKKEKKQEYKGQTSIKTFCKKLIEYSNGDAIIAEAIIEQSIANNWAGIFELKINGMTKKQNDNVYE